MEKTLNSSWYWLKLSRSILTVEIKEMISDHYSTAAWLPGVSCWNCHNHHHPRYAYVCIQSSSHSWSLFKLFMLIVASKEHQNTTAEVASPSLSVIRSVLHNNASSVQLRCNCLHDTHCLNFPFNFVNLFLNLLFVFNSVLMAILHLPSKTKNNTKTIQKRKSNHSPL